MKNEKNLVWIDLEMTGLHPNHDTILEIATIITDGDLNILAEGPSLIIHHSDAVLSGMDEWNTEQHGKTGLTKSVQKSVITMAEAEEATLNFIQEYCFKWKSPLCGNSIGQDKNFLYRYMPNLLSYLHYRVIDVSTVKELVSRWYGIEQTYQKKGTHRALDDIKGSIEELRMYRSKFFI